MTWVDILIQILTSFFGSLGFGVLFHVRGRKLLFSSLGGLIAWALFLLLGCWIPSEILRYFFVSVLISVYSEILARLCKTPATTFSVLSLIPLIPGGSLYYTMTYALQGSEEFFSKALHTLGLASALSVGLLLVTAVVRTWKRFRSQ